MKVPTKQALRDEIEQLKKDLFTAMDKLEDKELFYKLALRNPGYYHWYFEREAEKSLLAGDYMKKAAKMPYGSTTYFELTHN